MVRLLDDKRLDYFFELCRDVNNSFRSDKEEISVFVYNVSKIAGSFRKGVFHYLYLDDLPF